MSLLFSGRNLRLESVKRGDYLKPISFTGYGSIAGVLNLQTKVLRAGPVQINEQGDVTGVKTLTATGDITTAAKFQINEFAASGRIQTAGPFVNLSGGYYDFSAVGSTDAEYGSTAPYYTRDYASILPSVFPMSTFIWGANTTNGEAHLLIEQGSNTFTYAFGVGTFTADMLVDQFNGSQAVANNSPLRLSYDASTDAFSLSVDDTAGALLEPDSDEPNYMKQFTVKSSSLLLVLMGFVSPETALAGLVTDFPSTNRSLASTLDTAFALRAGAAQGFYTGGRNKNTSFDLWSPVSQTWVGAGQSQSITTQYIKSLSESRISEGLGNEQLSIEMLTNNNIIEAYATITTPIVTFNEGGAPTSTLSMRREVLSPVFRMTDEGCILIYDSGDNEPVASRGNKPAKSTITLRSRGAKTLHGGPSLAFEGSYSNQDGGDSNCYVYAQIKGMAPPIFDTTGISTTTGGHLVMYTAGNEPFDIFQATVNPKEALRINESQQVIVGTGAIPGNFSLNPRLLINGNSVFSNAMQVQGTVYVGSSPPDVSGYESTPGIVVDGQLRTTGDAYIGGALSAGSVSFSSVSFSTFSVETVTADAGVLGSITFSSADGESAHLTTAIVDTLTSTQATISNASMGSVTIVDAQVANLTSPSATFSSLMVDSASINGSLSLSSLALVSLTASRCTVSGALQATEGSVTSLTSMNISGQAGSFNTLAANNMTVDSTLAAHTARLTSVECGGLQFTGTLTGPQGSVTALTSTHLYVTSSLDASAGSFSSLSSAGVTISSLLTGNVAGFNSLTSSVISASTLTSTTISCSSYTGTSLVVTGVLTATDALVSTLTSTKLSVSSSITANAATFSSLTSSGPVTLHGPLTAGSATFTSTLVAASQTVLGTLTSSSGYFSTLHTVDASVTGVLTSASASISSLTAPAAVIDTLTSSNANITTLVSTTVSVTGAIASGSISGSSISGTVVRGATLESTSSLVGRACTLSTVSAGDITVTGTMTSAVGVFTTLLATAGTFSSVNIAGGGAVLSSMTSSYASISNINVSTGTVSLQTLTSSYASFTTMSTASGSVTSLSCSSLTVSSSLLCGVATFTSATTDDLRIVSILRAAAGSFTTMSASTLTISNTATAYDLTVSNSFKVNSALQCNYTTLPTFSSRQIGYQAAYSMGANTLLTTGQITSVGTSSAVSLPVGVWSLEGSITLLNTGGSTGISGLQVGFASSPSAFDSYSPGIAGYRYTRDNTPRTIVYGSEATYPVIPFLQTISLSASTSVYFLVSASFEGSDLVASSNTFFTVTRIA